MQIGLTKISSSLFVLIIICFFLPFVSVSCDNKELVKFTGIQLVTGTEIKTAMPLWQEVKKIPSQVLAIIPFGLAIAGALLGLREVGKLSAGLRILFGLAGGLALFSLKTKLADEVLKYPKMVFIIDYLPYYWAALGLFIAVAVVNAVSLLIKEKVKMS